MQGAGEVAPIARGGGAGNSSASRVALTRRVPSCGRSARAAAGIHRALPGCAHPRRQVWAHVAGGNLVGSARPGSPWRSRRVGSPQECERRRVARRPGSFRAPRRLRRRQRSRLGASCRGDAAGAQAAADHAIPQPTTRAHLCRDKDTQGFSKHQGNGGQTLDVNSYAVN
ncbi:uncharacterized protein LOC116090331 [Mastomys coucha]|uniref:uncharacterized protein LOC116090331 n=1 Tax=Mastomys coucha TaxID=35658 RepID=UPI0012618ADA|nr:uncharacterized protein LOC116090331 [Mastomys coucha]